MYPLKIAFLWHKHQPCYQYDGEFLMPWVRLHGVKDYFDLPEVLHKFPQIRQTFNIVPSLHKQINEYINKDRYDKVQRLTLIEAEKLTDDDKREILKNFFLCNEQNMIQPYPRYWELFEKSRNHEEALKIFQPQDWRDLQVWYNLTWIGHFSRQVNFVKRYFEKGGDFTESEKKLLMDHHIDILRKIVPQLSSLSKLGQAEISVSPMYHPILPLLCNSESALEALPNLPMPEPIFKSPEDAKEQVKRALEFHKNEFGETPAGMWPSEGSLSDEAIDIMTKSGFKWIASDEDILKNSMKGKFKETEKFFPRKFSSKSGDIGILFRDHFLSDRIGFVYSQWHPFDAANDFCHHLHNIRNAIIKDFGDEGLKHAAVSVMLDGENCWEYYRDNGVPFLDELYKQLTNAKEFETITCSEAAADEHLDYLPAINHVQAGSWIYGNFSIWIGHDDDRKGWAMIAKAREALIQAKKDLSKEQFEEAMEELYIAEGSDWFWWYGDEHQAENKSDFDVLFRWHIENVYKIIGSEVPEEVYIPITDQEARVLMQPQKKVVNPIIDGKIKPEPEWDGAGWFEAKSMMSAMHQVGELLRRLWYASGDDSLHFRFDTVRKLHDGESIEINFLSPAEFKITVSENGFNLSSEQQLKSRKVIFASEDIIEFALSKDMVFGDQDNDNKNVEINITTKSHEGEITYPQQGNIKLQFL